MTLPHVECALFSDDIIAFSIRAGRFPRRA
jgi:hypothetical protein